MDITVYGFKEAGTYEAISSKSYVHRLMIAAALSEDSARIATNIRSEDMEATARCLRAMGAEVRFEDGAYVVQGVFSKKASKQTPGEKARVQEASSSADPGAKGEVVLDCGESGSTERFLLPVAVCLCGEVVVTGSGRLPVRPLDELTKVLEGRGVSFVRHDERAVLPLTAEGKLEPGEYRIAGNISSQYITGLLFALPLLETDSFISLTTPLESAGYIDITLDVLSQFGIEVKRTPGGFFVRGNQRYRAGLAIQAEGDWSNAAYILSLGSIKGKVGMTGLNRDSVQGDAKILEVLEKFGAKTGWEEGTVFVERDSLNGVDTDVSQIPDLVPALAIPAVFADSPSVFRSVERLRLKESDRVESVIRLVETFGGKARTELRDGSENLIITPRISRDKETITADGAGDHRIVMALALGSEAAGIPVRIAGAEAVNKSFPGFFDLCVTDTKAETGEEGRCVIICAGPDDGNKPDPGAGDLVIAADAGFLHARRLGIVPDIVIGDLDSLSILPKEISQVIDSGSTGRVGNGVLYEKAGVKPAVIRLNPIKDDTDTLSSIKYGLKQGFRHFELYFASGGRTAHTVANIQCLKFMKDRGADGIIYDKNTAIRLLANESFEFDEGYEGFISVFAFGKAKGVTIKGFKYEMSAGELDNGFPLGVSNEFTGRRGKVSVKDGELLVFYNTKE